MPKFPCSLVGQVLIAMSSLTPWTATACDIPVFRYALERWQPDPFVVVMFHRGPLTSEQEAALIPLKSAAQNGTANLLVRTVDVGKSLSGAVQSLWQEQGEPPLPWVVVRFPPQSGITRAVWRGPWSADLSRALIDSPARRELARRLLAGESAVWLVVESGEASRDDAVARTLETESRKLEQSLILPKLSTDDPPLHLVPPLKIAFSVLRVSRSDPAERLFVDQLFNWDASLKAVRGAVIFPVYGRGRILPPVLAERIQTGVSEVIARMLTGPCSCQIKSMNTGFDLLMSCQWDEGLASSVPTSPREPVLTGLSSLALATATGATRDEVQGGQKRQATAFPVAPMAAKAAPAKPAGKSELIRNLVATFGGGVLFAAAATVILKRRTTRESKPYV
jgi:hypothetical protein